jgi:predicted ATPase
MLFSISGSQGQGKTTIVKELEKTGKYKVLINNVSRGILKDWGYSLNEVNKYGPLTRNFQEEIMTRFVKIIDSVKDLKEIYITERSFADIFSYAIFVLGPFNEYSEWLNQYYKNCIKHQHKFEKVFYLTGRTYTPVDDGVRSINIHYSKAVDRGILQYLNEFKKDDSSFIQIDEPSVEKRVLLIEQTLEKYL